jgi:predicted dehydrogenase
VLVAREGASAQWLSNIHQPGSPFTESPWRRAKGGLWDVGPHALSVVTTTLGVVTAVRATAGPRDLVTMVLTHETGAVSTVTTSLTVPPRAAHCGLTVWGSDGRHEMPTGTADGSVEILRVAIRELVDEALTGRRDVLSDIRMGRDVVAVLAEAQHQVDAGLRLPVSGTGYPRGAHP